MLRFSLPAVIGFALTAANVCAGEPKVSPVSLADLKIAVKKAGQRGDNVIVIAETMTALEKALAKFAGKPAKAPLELFALRRAVETASKKGENVGAISKELGLIEKALIGRAYTDPKPPPSKEDPTAPDPGDVVVTCGIHRVIIGGSMEASVTVDGGNFNTRRIAIADGGFTITARNCDINYTITGDLYDEGKKIVIQVGEKKIEAADIKKVPEEHRSAVEELLRMFMIAR